MAELTKIQRGILTRIKSGERCLLERTEGKWFMENDYKRCSKQVRILERKGYIQIKGDGMFREINIAFNKPKKPKGYIKAKKGLEKLKKFAP